MFFGRSDWTWTSGLLVPNQARYQTALHPAFLSIHILYSFFVFCKRFRNVLRYMREIVFLYTLSIFFLRLQWYKHNINEKPHINYYLIRGSVWRFTRQRTHSVLRRLTVRISTKKQGNANVLVRGYILKKKNCYSRRLDATHARCPLRPVPATYARCIGSVWRFTQSSRINRVLQ